METVSALQDALDGGATRVVLTEPLTGDAQITLPSASSPNASVDITIPAGASVGTLTVNKGSVKIYGTVDAAAKGSGMSATVTGFGPAQVGRTQPYLPDTPGWSVDRCLPAGWESSHLGRSNVFKLTVDATTHPAARVAAQGNKTAYGAERYDTR
ncbi:MAG: hypothetical protein LBU95_05070 [Rikenellaceae bacterium]|nr:hypothetical protein [Rikenellaceae bacterium]